MGLQPVDDAVESSQEAVELGLGHRPEERARERFVIAREPAGERLPARGEGDEGRAAVPRVGFARNEAACDKGVDEPSHCARGDPERVGEDALRHGSALPQLPEEMGAGRGQSERRDRLRHVVVEQDDKRQNTVEEIFLLV